MATCKDGDLALVRGEIGVQLSLSRVTLHSTHKAENKIGPMCSVRELFFLGGSVRELSHRGKCGQESVESEVFVHRLFATNFDLPFSR